MSTTASAIAPSDQAKGMTIMIVAALAVPSLDAIAKFLGGTISPMQVAFTRYAVQMVILVGVLLITRRTILTPGVVAVMPKLAFMGLLMASSVSALFWSLLYLPLATALAIFFVEPLILTLFGAVFLGERVGWHRRAAILVGFVGAIVVLRPNIAAFGWAAILPVIAAAGFAGMLTTLRTMRGSLDTLRTQAWSGGFSTLFLGLALAVGVATEVPLLQLTQPTTPEWGLLLLLGAMATGFQLLFTIAIRLAEASVLAPFQYLEIVTATALGYIIFNEFPDALTWTGTAIILASGLYVIHRERREEAMRIKAKARVV